MKNQKTVWTGKIISTRSVKVCELDNASNGDCKWAVLLETESASTTYPFKSKVEAFNYADQVVSFWKRYEA